MTAIKYLNKLTKSDNLVLIGNRDSNWKGYGLTQKEIDYIKASIKRKLNLVTINKYSQVVFAYITNLKDEGYKRNENARKAAFDCFEIINDCHLKGISVVDMEGDSSVTLSFVEGLALSNYQFLKYYTRTNTRKSNSLKSIGVYGENLTKHNVDNLRVIIHATCKARDLVNEPVIYLNATQLSNKIKELGADVGLKVEVLNKAKIESLKMGGLLAVNAGSVDPPTFNIMEWKPGNPVNKKPYVLVGKGVVYDTGGLSLKPTPDSMDTMKCDMAGAAAAICTIWAVAKAKLPIHLVALVPSTDNRPGGNAYVPGDVITMYNGMSVEVLNTDAEGRLILADALSYAKKYNPELTIDLATLTGAAMRAIGPEGIVFMGNSSDETKEMLVESGNESYERLVEFPLWEEYNELIKSDIADIKNIGGASAGAITAGKFLEYFTNYPWIHLDIAGPAFLKKQDFYRGKNGTGVGVRLLFDFFSKLANNNNDGNQE